MKILGFILLTALVLGQGIAWSKPFVQGRIVGLKLVDDKDRSITQGADIISPLLNRNYTHDLINKTIKDLFKLGLFRHVSFQVFKQPTHSQNPGKESALEVVFIIKWKQMIDQIEVKLDKDYPNIALDELEIGQQSLGNIEYHPTALSKIQVNIRAILRGKGYYQPIVHLKPYFLDNAHRHVGIVIEVKKLVSCFISEVEIFSDQSKLDKMVELPLGIACSADKVNSFVEKSISALAKKGYYKVAFRTPVFHYDKQENTAKLEVHVKYGVQIKYKIVDQQFDPFLTKERSEAIDFSNLDPEEVVYNLEDFYRERGYYFVKVEMKVLQKEKNLESYELFVDAGPRVNIGNIQIDGYSLDPEALENILEPTRFALFKTVFSEKFVRDKLRSIESLYFEKGYADVKISDPEYEFSEDKKLVNVRVLLEEGKPYLIDEVGFEGNKAFTQEKLLAAIPFKEGQPLNQTWVNQVKTSIRRLYLSHGYTEVTIKLSHQIQTINKYHSLTSTIKIGEGQQLIIGKISIEGLRFTKMIVVEREINLKTGMIFTPARISDNRNRLMKLGLFESVRIQPMATILSEEETKQIHLVIKIREKKPGTAEFKPGWGTYKGARFSMGLSYANLGGFGGRRVFQTLKVSQEAQQERLEVEPPILGYEILVGFTEPYILRSQFQGTITYLLSNTADKQFHLNNETFELNFLRPLTPHLRMNLGYKLKKSRYVRDKVNDNQSTLLNFDRVQTGAFIPNIFGDWRDNPKWPLEGGVLALSIDVARKSFLFSDMDYNKYFLYGSFYKGIYGRVGINIHTQIGQIDVMSGKQCGNSGQEYCLPPQEERFFTGGTGSVRGYEERSLGPTVTFERSGKTVTERVGGTLLFVNSFEIKFPAPYIGDQFGLVIFYDAGNAYFRNDDIAELENANLSSVTSVSSLLDISLPDLRKSLGMGIVMFPNVFSLHLDYGIPWSKIEQEGFASLSEGRLHINIGGVL